MKINNKIRYNIFLESSSMPNINNRNKFIYTASRFIFIIFLSLLYVLSVGFIIGGLNYIIYNLNKLKYFPNNIILHYIGITIIGLMLLIINLLFTSNIFKKIK